MMDLAWSVNRQYENRQSNYGWQKLCLTIVAFLCRLVAEGDRSTGSPFARLWLMASRVRSPMASRSQFSWRCK